MSSARSASVRAPAKINVTLRVVGRRSDGYHELDSIMLPVDLYDEIEVTVDDRVPQAITIECDAPSVPTGSDNLAHRAAAVLLSENRINAAIAIGLRKRIPAASGLGGGSSDAAAVLTTLNRLLSASRTTSELVRLGARLGADVPFFVHGRPARVEGIGEKISPLAGWGGLPLVVARPSQGLSTAAIYRRYDAVNAGSSASLTKRVSATSIADFAAGRVLLRDLLVNDLEAVAVELCPELVSLKTLLLKVGAEGALMTGSGSAVFGIWPSRLAAEAAAEMVRGRGYWAVAAQTLDRSPAAA